ncbi:phage baseplate protein [Pectinatus frisingensis]|uniref:phage baseplate protein n=1 Tax=Pectinatus frisingensis TaxID=865 RepID=UPI0018C83CBF|nr:hypothetical protein [Pectinatus frisingensis]
MASESLLLPALVEPSMFDDFEFDVVQEISPSYDAELTDNPVETGFVIADHVIKKPVKLNLTVLFTPTNVTWADRRGGVSQTRLQDVEKQLYAIRDKGEPGTVKTQLNIYENMVLTSAKLSRDKTGFKIIANLEFTQAIIVDTQTTDVPEEYASQASNAATSDATSADSTTAQSQAGATNANAGTASTSTISADTNNADTSETGSEETASTANKSILASMADAL